MSPPAEPLSTSPTQPTERGRPAASPDWIRNSIVWLLLSAMFALVSLGRVSIPGVNEPHYLTKARHYWQPEWCQPAPSAEWPRGDVFLDSANPHEFFYATIGRLTAALPLAEAAWYGRLVGAALLGLGWWRLCAALQGDQQHNWLRTCFSAAVFCLLTAAGNWSGEWVVGGIESKVPAYGLLLYGVGELLLGHPLRGALGVGLAISFHPLVGVWGLLASGGMLLWSAIRGTPLPGSRFSWMGGAAVCALFAVPGLWPALRLLLDADPQQAVIADFLMVSQRLKHHLDPLAFPVSNWRYFACLLVTWGLLRLSLPGNLQERRWEMLVLLTVLIAGLGVVVAWTPRPMQLGTYGGWQLKVLKFYPFRLADALVPMALAWTLTVYLEEHMRQRWGAFSEAGWPVAAGLGSVLCVALAISIPGPDRRSSGMSLQHEADWIACCHWIREHTPTDAVLYATNERWAVKWFAERSEYVNYKDCPQDAASLVEWNRRQWIISKWREAAFTDWKVTRAELIELRQQTGITHLLSSRFGPVAIEPVYSQGIFRVYELP